MPLQVKATQTGSKTTAGIQKIGQEDLKEIVIPLPPEQEMDATLKQLTDGHIDLDAWPDSFTLRQSILHAAFTGRLFPQDPADEPAAALLARLRDAPAAPRRARARTPFKAPA